MRIDYVTDKSGDWEGIFIDKELWIEAHSIDPHRWVVLLGKLQGQTVETYTWQSDLTHNECSRFPMSFDNVPGLERA